ncbi:MAG: hypothetical protein JNG84_08720 [Archangium sp.]|nr:hypothetical protein [Archangium sp.]
MLLARVLAAACVVTMGCAATSPCGPSTCVPGCCVDGECVDGKLRRACGLTGDVCAVCASTELCVAGACAPDPRFDPDSGVLRCTCTTGCCGDDGECLAGNTVEACGKVLAVCAACGEGERCDSGRCTSVPCTGCLDAMGVCQLGTNDVACGSGGGLCLGCVAGQRCSSGRCIDAPCNASTCPEGCCNATQRCVQPSDTSCGTGGDTCVTCPADTKCLFGQCLPP